MPVFYRVWCLRPEHGTCRYCRQAICWRLLDTGKRIPLNPEARPLRTDQDERGRRFDVFDGIASHLWTCLGKSLRKKPR